jgi:hypothetical protein
METEKRIHPRFCPNGLNATITLVPPAPNKELILEGTIIDMSYSGIKIKLKSPINSDLSESEIKINFIIPESGLPVSIHGVIKHLNDHSECGLQYSAQHTENKIDDVMFECIKLTDKHIQRIITHR